VEHYENLGQTPLTTDLHHTKYSSIKVCCFITLKVKVKGTLAMKKTLEEEDTLLQAGTIETSDVESKDTLFG
jgi:hypothetical protein